MSTVKEISDFLLGKFPLSICCDYDQGKLGLEVGSLNAKVNKIMICLDATTAVIEEAIKNNVDLIITHHPMIWSPQLTFNVDSVLGSKLSKLMINKINVFAMHTNFDNGEGGMNEILASLLGLKDVHAEYEELSKDTTMRIGTIDEISLREFAVKVKNTFKEPCVRVVGDLDKKVSNIGLIGGGGGGYAMQSKRSGIDCYLSGEFHHNNAIDAIEAGFALVEVSHYVEHVFKPFVKDMLEKEFNDLTILIANEKCPFNYL